jgi:hypothetical protein
MRVIVGPLMLLAGIILSYILVLEEEDAIVSSHPIFAQLGIPSDSILLNKTNTTIPIVPTITENTPATTCT